MPAPLSLSRCTITRSTEPDEPLTGVSILVRAGDAKVRRGRELVAQALVSKVERAGIKSFTLTLLDGSTWTVVRDKNCGCGG